MAGPILGTCPTKHSGEKAIEAGWTPPKATLGPAWPYQCSGQISRCKENPLLNSTFTCSIQNISLISTVHPKRNIFLVRKHKNISLIKLLSSCKAQIQSQHSPTCYSVSLHQWLETLWDSGAPKFSTLYAYPICKAMWVREAIRYEKRSFFKHC